MTSYRYHTILATLTLLLGTLLCSLPAVSEEKSAGNQGNLVYLVSDLRIPFWEIMARGIKSGAVQNGYNLEIYSAENSAKKELQFASKAIRDKVNGIIVSPTTSAACATILKLAKQADIPVVIADIGTDGGDYISFISSDNRDGAYQLGKILAQKMQQLNWQDGKVGIIAIPQKRANGQARTAGFMQAMNEAGIKGAGIRQQVDFSYEETYKYAKELISSTNELRAIWLQGSDKYKGAMDAITEAGKQGQILLLTFDAEPEFLELIPQGKLLAAGMQQPFLMGEQAAISLHNHLAGKTVEQNQQLSVLAVSSDNITEKLPIIRRNVLGQ